MIPEEIKIIYSLVLIHRNKIRVLRRKKHRDKAISFSLSSKREYHFLEIILGGAKSRRWRIKPT